MPITLRDLRDMERVVDLLSVTGMALWVAILVSLYGLYHKDNLMVGKGQTRNTKRALVSKDMLFAVTRDVIWLRVRHSKIKCRE
ncbi:hypothetical protein CYMTET_52806 [Cymbomonas tetramitiformis]|uniref:Uncharacterized protein n=1 Tax=Cymbomonas tetramitiformis TaxID=36881 RepID=A0AAE0ER90_9CHLO|nr:hypothetical protein CYMTET_52806 [Cymbomonas tetramitiformis]